MWIGFDGWIRFPEPRSSQYYACLLDFLCFAYCAEPKLLSIPLVADLCRCWCSREQKSGAVSIYGPGTNDTTLPKSSREELSICCE